jgi:hypothetical protein
LATAGILSIAVRNDMVGVPFVNDLGSKAPVLLGSLLIVSLFVERVIEVFVSIWRDEETDNLEQQLAYSQDIQARRKHEIADLVKEETDPQTSPERKKVIEAVKNRKYSELGAAEKSEDDSKTQLVPKYAHTRRVSTWVGMAVGMLAAAVGFRFLYQIVDLGKGNLQEAQRAWFAFADVLLTGTILAGGSKAIHSIFAVYDSFMESTKKRANASATTAAARSSTAAGA